VDLAHYKTSAAIGPNIEERWFNKEQVVQVDYEAQRVPAPGGGAPGVANPKLTVTLVTGALPPFVDPVDIQKVATKLGISVPT
jgi:hypothetical protein